jgi:hypothetical protein
MSKPGSGTALALTCAVCMSQKTGHVARRCQEGEAQVRKLLPHTGSQTSRRTEGEVGGRKTSFLRS